MNEDFDLSDIFLACDSPLGEGFVSETDLSFDCGKMQLSNMNESMSDDNTMQNRNTTQNVIINNVTIKTEISSFKDYNNCNYDSSKEDDDEVSEHNEDSLTNGEEDTNDSKYMRNNTFKTEENEVNRRVRTEEEIRLREFDLLDEVGPFDDKDDNGVGNFDDEDDDGEVGDEASDDDDDDDDDELEVAVYSEDEIDAMLDARLEQFQPPKKRPCLDGNLKDSTSTHSKSYKDRGVRKDIDYVERDKIVLIEKCKNHFEVLPDGWVSLTHNSGMPLYLHRATRVCTLSKPYYLGPGSARKHAIPLSAVPCLEYKRAKEEEERRKNSAENDVPNVLIVNGTEIPSARVETAQENEASRQLTPEQLTEYCKQLFEFEKIQVYRFKSWVARRKFNKEKNERIHQRPTLPKDTKLITCPIRQSNDQGRSGNIREWIMNPNGKSYVCILHEYVQRALKDQPVYTFKELENTATPYLALVHIGEIQYGTGYGSSKKLAKHDAAKATLEILIPEMKDKIYQDEKIRGHAGCNRKDPDLSFFDGIKIEDPRVTELCAKTTEPLPHEILLTCLQRNFGLSQMNIKYETTPLKHCRNEFTMMVGNHTAKVVCRNKRDGKQRASQAILQALHPHIPSWGSLLRLYGSTSVKTVKEKKIEEQEITLLQNRGTTNSPNYAILNKLREEMKKFKAIRSAIKPIGKFIPPDDIDLPAESGADLSNVKL